jgi:hypothetical protein
MAVIISLWLFMDLSPFGCLWIYLPLAVCVDLSPFGCVWIFLLFSVYRLISLPFNSFLGVVHELLLFLHKIN